MTLAEAIKSWTSGPACLVRKESARFLAIHPDGNIYLPREEIVPPHYFTDDQWELHYLMNFTTDEVLEALKHLDDDISSLITPEWNDWDTSKSVELVCALARALNVKIEGAKSTMRSTGV